MPDLVTSTYSCLSLNSTIVDGQYSWSPNGSLAKAESHCCDIIGTSLGMETILWNTTDYPVCNVTAVELPLRAVTEAWKSCLTVIAKDDPTFYSKITVGFQFRFSPCGGSDREYRRKECASAAPFSHTPHRASALVVISLLLSTVVLL